MGLYLGGRIIGILRYLELQGCAGGSFYRTFMFQIWDGNVM